MTPEHSCALLQARNKRLKQALRRVLRAVAALEDERQGSGTCEDLIDAVRAQSEAINGAKKVLKET